MTIRKAISYIRMSTERQLQGHSLDRQLKATKDYCARNNLELVEELTDIGLSGYSGAHRTKGQLGVFFDAMRNNEIESNTVLIVESLDRLSRQDPLTAMSQFSEMLTYGIELHTLFDGQVYTKESVGSNMGLLFLSIGSMIRAYDESQTKSKRLSSVWSKKKKDPSKIITSQVPHWVDVVKNVEGKPINFKLYEPMAKVIRHIFHLSLNNNQGVYSIVRMLNEDGSMLQPRTNKRNKDKGWSESYVKSLFRNKAVYGAYQPHKRVNGKRVPDGPLLLDYYPAVISEEEFYLNRAKIKDRIIRGTGRSGDGFPNLFRGLLVCHICGSSITYKDAKKDKGGPIIRCLKSMQNRGCKSMAVRYQSFEDLMFQVMSDIDFISVVSEHSNKGLERELELKISSLQHKKSKLESTLEKLVDELLSEGLSEALKPSLRARMNRQQDELDNINQELNNINQELLTSQEGVGGLFDDVRSLMVGVGGDELVQIRSSVNNGLKKVLNKIEIDNSPLFSREDVEWGVEEIGLDPSFLEWFNATRTDRWLIKDPIAYVGTKQGYAQHQRFRTTNYLFYKSGELRMVNAKAKVFKMSAKSRKPFGS